jgi:polar amino acid transport system substrate-binding protein
MRIILVSIVLLICRPLAAETLTIVSDHWYPMNGDPTSTTPGYMIELAQAVFKPYNIKVDYKTLPWERAVKQTREGHYNCVVGAYKSDTPDFIFPDSHWGFDSPKFFTALTDPWHFTGLLTSLGDRKIGIIQGYTYEDKFDEYAKKNSGLHVQFVRGESALETNIKKLLAGRINTFIDSSSVVYAKLNEMKLDYTLKEAGSIIQPIRMYMACSPNMESSRRYTDIINKETARLIASGELEKILNRYGLKMWTDL